MIKYLASKQFKTKSFQMKKSIAIWYLRFDTLHCLVLVYWWCLDDNILFSWWEYAFTVSWVCLLDLWMQKECVSPSYFFFLEKMYLVKFCIPSLMAWSESDYSLCVLFWSGVHHSMWIYSPFVFLLPSVACIKFISPLHVEIT